MRASRQRSAEYRLATQLGTSGIALRRMAA
jgi:hypothetical protein